MSRQKDQTGSDRAWHQWAWFVLVMLVASVLRLWRLGDLPPGIFRDEAEKALNGWFILTSGMDASGRPWPLFIEVFGVTTSAIYQYATIPFLAVGGLNEWTARLPAACTGIATVALTFVLVRHIWNWQTAIWAAALLAVSSWHVPLSRWAQQGIFLPLFFTAAAYCTARFVSDEKPRTRWLALAGVCVAMAMYAYDPARLFAPLLGIAAVVIWWPVWKTNRRAVAVAAATFALFVSPVTWLLLTQSEAATARFRYLSIAQPGMSPGEILMQFARNYGSHFSPFFLLQTGDAELRHGGGKALINIIEFSFVIVACFYAFSKRDRWALFFIAWILLAPVPASLTREGVPHALRTQLALPVWQMLASFGLWSMMGLVPRSSRRWRYNMLIWPLVLVVITWNFCLTYFGTYSRDSAFNWQYGVKQSLQYLNQPTTQNSNVLFYYVTGAEYIVPFYLQMTRAEFRRMLAGQSRYQIVEHHTPMENWQLDPPERPRAIVAPFGAPPVQGGHPMFIDAPDSPPRTAPVMQIFLSPELLDQITAESDI